MNPPPAALISLPVRNHLPQGLAQWTAIEGHRLVIGLPANVDARALPLAVARAAGDDFQAVVFDLASVNRLDTPLLAAVLRCEAGLAVSGVEVRLRNVSPRSRRALALRSLTSLLE